jgi:hypothetical protein
MAEFDERAERSNGTVLIAYVTVHLESGESFELLPFEDAEDVKTKVCELMKAWAKSGFLIRGSHIYPWHRVRRIEATKVEELSLSDSRLRMEEWKARDTAQMQNSFWKTKRLHKETEERDEGYHDGGRPPSLAA